MSQRHTPFIERAYNLVSILFFLYSLFFLLGMFYDWFTIKSLEHFDLFIGAFSIAFIVNGMVLLFVANFPKGIKNFIFYTFTPALLILMVLSMFEISF